MTPEDLLPLCTELHTKRKIAGVYLIYCSVNQHGYVGSSVRVYQRLSVHQANLNSKRHPNAHLQAAWSKYGKAAFRMLLVEQCVPAEVLTRERWLYEQLDPALRFNQQVPMPGREPGFKMSDRHRKIMSEVNKGHTRNRGRKHSPESIQLMRQRQMKPVSEETRAKMRAALKANPPRAKLTRENVAEIRRLHAEAVVLGGKTRAPNGFPAILAKQFGVTTGCIDSVVNGPRWR